jgi:hypothetical protein
MYRLLLVFIIDFERGPERYWERDPSSGGIVEVATFWIVPHYLMLSCILFSVAFISLKPWFPS